MIDLITEELKKNGWGLKTGFWNPAALEEWCKNGYSCCIDKITKQVYFSSSLKELECYRITSLKSIFKTIAKYSRMNK